MATKKKPTKPEPESEIQEAEVVEEPKEKEKPAVPDPKNLVEETPPGNHPTLNELEHDPTAINRVDVKNLTEQELAALARCGLRIEVSNPEDRAAAQRLFKTRNAIERVLTKLTGGKITMGAADNMDQKVLEEQIAALVAQRLAQGGQVQQQPAQPEEEKAFFDTTAGTAVKYGAAMAGGAALLYGGQKLFGGDCEEVAALALNLADAW